MLPGDLKPERFAGYPPQARKLATDHLPALEQLPLSILPTLLREVIDYDFKFPAERRTIERHLTIISALSAEQEKEWFHSFEQIKLSPQLQNLDWVNAPAQFVEQLSSHLWTTHQQDAFRAAAMDFAERLERESRPELPVVPRLGISIIGKGVDTYSEPLFRKLRPHGAYFTRVKPENGLPVLLNAITARAKAHPVPYGHWYIDGGEEAEHDPALTTVSYGALQPVRTALLRKMQSEIQRPGMGPEMLRTLMAKMHPSDVGIAEAADPVLDRFQVKLLTEGSGTQIFATSFAQWAAREALSRAQPLTLLVRFAPRQRQKPMNELLSPTQERAELDPLGSLVDADMGAYYNWINQQRLPSNEQSLFLVWFENHGQALAISPAMARGTESTTATDLGQLLSWMS